MVNIPHPNNHMAVINNLPLDSILLSKADTSNRRVIILLMADLLRLSNPMVVTSNSRLLHNTTARLLDLRKVTMELPLLTSSTSSRTANLLLRRQDSTARLLLTNMAHHQSSLPLPHWATDHLRSSNTMANPTLTVCERP
jgi:hypothetical protein